MASRGKGRRAVATLPEAPVALGWLLAAPVALATVAGGFRPVLDAVTDMPALLAGVSALVGAAWLLGTTHGRARLARLSAWRPAWALGAVWVALLIAAALSGRAGLSLFGYPNSAVGLVQLASVTLVALAAAVASGPVRGALFFAAPIVVVVQSATVLAQSLTGAEPNGTLSNPVYASQTLLLALAVTAWAASETRETLERRALAAVIALGLIAIGLAGSRVAIAVALAGAAWAALVQSRQHPTPRRLAGFAGLAAAVPIVALAAGPRLRTALDLELVAGDRPRYWESALRAVADSPLVGHGPDSFLYESVRVADAVGQTRLPEQVGTDPHNLVLAALVTGGILLLAALAWLATETAIEWRHHGKGPHRWFAAGAVLYLLTGLVQPLHLQTLPLFALVLGASMRPPARVEPAPRRTARAATLAPAGLLGALALISVAFASSHVVVGSESATPAAAVRAGRTADMWRVDPYLYYRASILWDAAGGASGGSGAATEAARRATELEPDDPVLALEYACMLGRASDPAADAAFQRALAIWPNSGACCTEYAEYLCANGREGDAAVQVAHLISLEGTRHVPAELLALVETGP